MHSLENVPCSMSNLNIRDSLEFLNIRDSLEFLNIRDSLEFLNIKNNIHGFAIKSDCFFLRSLLLTYRSSRLLPSVLNGIPNSLINRFQECFHTYFLVGIIVHIKVRQDHKRVTVFHDNRGQGSTLRSMDLNTRANPL